VTTLTASGKAKKWARSRDDIQWFTWQIMPAFADEPAFALAGK
jgi:hypothetical protein